MTEEQANHDIRAYLEERAIAEGQGDVERVALVDAELRRLGYEAQKPVEAAATREEATARPAAKPRAAKR